MKGLSRTPGLRRIAVNVASVCSRTCVGHMSTLVTCSVRSTLQCQLQVNNELRGQSNT